MIRIMRLDGGAGRRRLPHIMPANPKIGTVVFVTVGVARRRPLLANDACHALLRELWSEADRWRVGRYVVMPDHLHFVCCPSESPLPLGRWVGYWKRLVSQRWPHPGEVPVFQRDFFDRQLRSEESFVEKWAYIRDNPVRAGLVADWRDWPYQGEVFRVI